MCDHRVGTVRADGPTGTGHSREHARDWVACDKAFSDFGSPSGAVSLNRLPAWLRGQCARLIGR